MEKYQECTPSDYIKRVLGIAGDPTSAGHPFLITDQFGITKFPMYNLIQMNRTTTITIESITDVNLKMKLNQWQGFETIPPSYQLMAVPESTMEELKKPIASILKWATQFDDWISTDRVVEKLLGYLYNSFSERSRSNIRKAVNRILSDLSKGLLSGLLLYNSKEKSFLIEIEISNPQSRKAFSDRINEWLNIIPIEHFAEIWPIDDSDDNHEIE